jgi:excinuclease ABC subunit C
MYQPVASDARVAIQDFHLVGPRIVRISDIIAVLRPSPLDSLPCWTGKGQMTAVRETLEELGIDDVPLVAVAKGPHHGREGREVFHFPDGRERTLPVNSPVLFLVQRLRDEAHRYAIGAHREKRSRAITASPLDEIPGIGPARKRALLLHFGTASKVRAAALDDLKRAPGVSEAVAQAVYDYYHAGG